MPTGNGGHFLTQRYAVMNTLYARITIGSQKYYTTVSESSADELWDDLYVEKEIGNIDSFCCTFSNLPDGKQLSIEQFEIARLGNDWHVLN